MRHVGCVLLLGSALGTAACGKVQSFADAAAHDAASDAVAAGTVTVTTYTRSGDTGASGDVQSDVDVVVVAADGSVRDSGATDGSGEATLDVQAGDSVTAVYTRADGAELVTYLAVEPGDHLQFGEQFGAGGTQTATMTASWPAITAASFEVYHPCGPASAASGATSVTLYEYSDCAVTPFDALFVAYDVTTTSNISRWGLLSDVPFQNGGSAALGTWQVPSNFTIGANGLPPEVDSASIDAAAVINGGRGPRIQLDGTPTSGMLQASRPWATGGEGITASAGFYRAGEFGPQGTFERLDPSTTQWIAESPIRLPWFGTVIANAAAREITWITAGEGSPDGVLIFAQWSHYGTDGGFFSYNWTFVIPPGLDELRYPELPASLMPYAPQDEDFLYAYGFMIDFAADDGYDALRARPEWGISLFGLAPEEQIWVSISAGIGRVPSPQRPPLPAGWIPSIVLAP
jgi:hypothetical protein